MGFGDKLKNLKSQAQEAVAEHKDQIQEAVGLVSVAADEKTKGKYTAKIAKFGEKANVAVDKIGSEGHGAAQAAGFADTAPAPAGPGAPAAQPADADAAAGAVAGEAMESPFKAAAFETPVPTETVPEGVPAPDGSAASDATPPAAPSFRPPPDFA